MEIISSLITHVPETYRLVCLRSVVPEEEEERSFGDLRPISKTQVTGNIHMLLTMLFCVLELNKSTVKNKIHFNDNNQLLASRPAFSMIT
jgi:hypothetical protein